VNPHGKLNLRAIWSRIAAMTLSTPETEMKLISGRGLLEMLKG
jgi:hypothetical protein